MTDSQFTEVATKVWGWNYVETRRNKGWLVEEGGWYVKGKRAFSTIYSGHISPQYIPRGIRTDEELQIEIESWQGFGRTVEAMDKRNRHIFLNHSYVMFICNDSMCMEPEHTSRASFNDDLNQMEATIEATHLAALEALK